MQVGFKIKQNIKARLQNDILPKRYDRYRNLPIEKGKVIFADCHSDGLTPSMRAMYIKLRRMNMHIYNMCVDFSQMTKSDIIRYMNYFMKEYATAEYVIISSYFLPVSACEKRPETTVIQLWHSCGLMKKMGYDAKDDIPEEYKGNPSKNFDIVTVSSEACIKPWASGMGIPEDKVVATGVSRTDLYFSKKYNDRNIAKFYELYPEARGKKIAIYAPTFSGNAANPSCNGIESGIVEMIKEIGDEWYFIIKLHPHMEKKYPEYKCDIATEELLAVADVMISDYSSVIFDFLAYKKTVILYAPDYEEYERERGFYIDYNDFPFLKCNDVHTLKKAIVEKEYEISREALDRCYEYHMGMCDGRATDRILELAQIKQNEIELVALDLDGTLLGNDGRLSANSKNVVENLILSGVEVVIASGRSYKSLPEEVTSIRGIRYAICSNGATIYNNVTKEREKGFYLTRKAVYRIAKIASKYHVQLDAFYRDQAYIDKRYFDALDTDEWRDELTREYIKKTRKAVPSIYDFVRQHKDELDCLNITVYDPKLRRKIIKEINSEVPDIFFTASVPHLLEMSYKDAGKKNGLRYIAEKLNIKPDNIAAFGNADNDADMIEYAGYGYAVAESSDEAKKKAKFIIGSNDDDSVAKVLSQILKNRIIKR